ncbi:MAG TPA: NAD(P)H-quinone oxidoreductase [Thermoanaerobaculia bacterium]|nr:NAD(P)H-quinone oxidoreductase [Thermoanaerobaculia bacterium]
MLAVDPESRDTPSLAELPAPRPGRGEVLVAVRAAGLNHADLLQLRGHYPPPPGESPVPGLECAGVIEAVGEGVAGWRAGERVMALTAGGSHGERVAIPSGQLMTLPEDLSFVEGAAIPEAGLTAWTNLVAEGGLRSGETVLVTGATGGVGTLVVQLAAQLGARVLAAGRTPERLEPLSGLGAAALLPLDADLPARVREANGGRGADLALDLVGGEHLPRCLAALERRGRCVLVGLLAGRRAELDLGDVLSRRLHLVGSVLRARSRPEKAALVDGFARFALPRLADGRLRPVVDTVLPFERVAEAYAALAGGGVEGKIVVEMAGG